MRSDTSEKRIYLASTRISIAYAAILRTGKKVGSGCVAYFDRDDFLGAVAAGVVKYAFCLTEENAFLFCGLPASLMVLFYLYFNRHKLARAAGFD
jgi:hypothetical protein